MGSDTFTQLVDANYASLYRFALSLTRNQADACDLAQQTFFIWATKGQTLRDLSKAKSWLFTTLYREFLRGRRRGARATALDDLPPAEADPPAPAVDIIAAMDAQVVMSALQEVDEVFRVPLTLFYLEELSYQEIAEALDIPAGTVMSRLSRGKVQLRAILDRREKSARDNIVAFPSQQHRRTP
ncbi:MAG: RNA polymerase sigma factor [Opitutaceae bacterium]